MAALSYISYDQCFWGSNGYEVLKKHNKTSLNFLTDFISILQERLEIERDFSGKLSRLSQKCVKSSNLCYGNVQSTWSKFSQSLETESEIHTNLAQSLDTLSKNMREFNDAQQRDRKILESNIEKSVKTHGDRLSKQKSAVKTQISKLKELEMIQTMHAELKETKGKEKEIPKTQQKELKGEEMAEKCSIQLNGVTKILEEARLQWEGAMYRYSRESQRMEEQRIKTLMESINQYIGFLDFTAPKLQTTCQELLEVVGRISIQTEIESACSRIGTGENRPEQILYYGYEHSAETNLSVEFRRIILERRLTIFEQDILATQKAKEGVERLSSTYKDTPDFTTVSGQDDVKRQILEMDTLVNYFKANHFLVERALLELSSQPTNTSNLEPFIVLADPGKGILGAKLYMPISEVAAIARGQHESHYQTLPGPTHGNDNLVPNSSLPPSYDSIPSDFTCDIDSSQQFYDEDNRNSFETSHLNDPGPSGYLGKCIAQYDYEAQAYDELTIKPGDVIIITDRSDSDWWKGKLDDQIGVFPATYVTEIDS